MPLSPMMQQYRDMKEQYKDYILFYRLGDFYEMFFEDALIASKELEITLTGRDCGLDEKAPMCGVPYHSVDAYIQRLVQKGYKVTICEQIKKEDSNEVIGRDVVKIITPGTVTEPQMLDETKNSYIAGIYADDAIDGEIAICYADITTGEVIINPVYKKSDMKIINDISKFSPREAYVNSSIDNIPFLRGFLSDPESRCSITTGEKEDFVFEAAVEKIEKHMGGPVSNLDFGSELSVKAFGGLLSYLYRTQFCDLSHLKKISYMGDSFYMDIDYFTWRNLEITETMRSKLKRGSLLGVLDKTKTAMGARLLRKYLEKPLLDIAEITKRQNAVADFVERNIDRSEVRELLSGIKDIERLLSKVVYNTVNPRDMRVLAASFTELPKLKNYLDGFRSSYIAELNNMIDPLQDVYKLIDDSIVEEPPAITRDGNMIKMSYSKELSELKTFLNDNKKIMSDIEAAEKERTGIRSLKIGYNKVFGYYIEVSKSFVSQVPPEYIRKQTLVNGERYITAELKDIESKLLSANEDIVRIELEIYDKIKAGVSSCLDRIKKTADAVSIIDVLSDFAEISVKNNYTCPGICCNPVLEIKDGRHPVVEKMLSNELFIPNDTNLDNSDNMINLITGPNMAGKSTYMRQVAVIVLMAQIGCFVPASSANIGIIDKIFTRVGASDDLASGQSTFMIEMNEVAYILKNATEKSLLIFDEIGRGTSTFDGMSIAQSVIEYTSKKIKAKTLFATHYHELTSLEGLFPGVKNYNIAAKKTPKEITFLRKIVRGGTDDSYGIDVAKLAGVPKEVINRAEEILKELESGRNQKPVNISARNDSDEDQIGFGETFGNEIIDRLKMMDVTVMTPIEAMNELFAISKKVKENN